ncbi:hypothetical protein Nepgr_007791 [Nepenthes gracilis]|uniref:Uncharacterized protein n=1 Tax=Nepenthes gracilis TaxID=150966 RepID=A0AAD3S7Y4_NEPGR|nr:hypothetical protein Nepgr_007791 [Nepenthes gracilis]
MQLHPSHRGLPKWQQIFKTKSSHHPSVSTLEIRTEKSSGGEAETTPKPILTTYGQMEAWQSLVAYSIFIGLQLPPIQPRQPTAPLTCFLKQGQAITQEGDKNGEPPTSA